MEGISDRIAVARATAPGSANAAAPLGLRTRACCVLAITGFLLLALATRSEAAAPASSIGVDLKIVVTSDNRVQVAGTLRNYSYLKKIKLVLESEKGRRWTVRATKVAKLSPVRRRKPGLSQFKFFWRPSSTTQSATVRVRFIDGRTTLATSAKRVLKVRSGVGASGTRGGIVSVPGVTPPTPPGPAPTPPAALSLASGGDHSCAVTGLQVAKCWGSNDDGELGDGTTDPRTNPVVVAGLSSVSNVAVGSRHSCAVTTGGALLCWGSRADGQLGDGTGAASPQPVTSLAADVSSVAAGDRHTCALKTDGTIWCWGANEHGQLGDGTQLDSATPVQVGGLTAAAVQVTAGDHHTCAIVSGGDAQCWGSNESVQAADLSSQDALSPHTVPGVSPASVIDAGDRHTCVVSAGTVKCWGENYVRQLGTRFTSLPRVAPATYGIDAAVSSVTAGGHHACALLTSGSMRCWGTNAHGEQGSGKMSTHESPAPVIQLPQGAVSVVAGDSHTCAITPVGNIACWGANARHQLGNFDSADASSPVMVTGL